MDVKRLSVTGDKGRLCHTFQLTTIPLTADQRWQRPSLTLAKYSMRLTLVKGGRKVLRQILLWLGQTEVLLIAVKALTRVKCFAKTKSKVLCTFDFCVIVSRPSLLRLFSIPEGRPRTTPTISDDDHHSQDCRRWPEYFRKFSKITPQAKFDATGLVPEPMSEM